MEPFIKSNELDSPLGMSPKSISMSHGHFMAQMGNLQTNNVNDSPLKDKSGNTNGSISSSKVIESLHQQIDFLTSTNLQLTVQSNHFLQRLELANSKESKHLETINSLKHENDNLNSMFSRKHRRCKDLEDQMFQLKNSYEDAIVDFKNLQAKLNDKSTHEMKLEQQLQQLQVQYDALVDSQKRYKDYYEREIKELNDNLTMLKLDSENFFNKSLKNLLAGDEQIKNKLKTLETKYDLSQVANKEKMELVNNKVNVMTKDLNISSWEQLYKNTRDMAIEYAEKMDLSLAQDFENEHGKQGIFQERFLSNDVTSNGCSNVNNRMMPPSPLRVPKTKNPSGKRSSFYGGNLPSLNGPQATNISGSLPGVKRTASTRIRVSSSSPVSSTSLANFPSRHSSLDTNVLSDPSLDTPVRPLSRRISSQRHKRIPSTSK